MNHYYIYYRVIAHLEHEAEQVVRSMQARLACRSGIAGKLLKKRNDPGLWMEVYEQIEDPGRFERLLNQVADEFDVEMFTETPRKLECFSGEIHEAAICTRSSPAGN